MSSLIEFVCACACAREPLFRKKNEVRCSLEAAVYVLTHVAFESILLQEKNSPTPPSPLGRSDPNQQTFN